MMLVLVGLQPAAAALSSRQHARTYVRTSLVRGRGSKEGAAETSSHYLLNDEFQRCGPHYSDDCISGLLSTAMNFAAGISVAPTGNKNAAFFRAISVFDSGRRLHGTHR